MSDRMTPKSTQSAQPKRLQPWLKIGGSNPGHFTIGTKPGSKCFDPDKFGTKISGIRCSTNFTLTTFHQIHKEKSYSRKTRFSSTPKKTFFAYKTRATDARVTKKLSKTLLRSLDLPAKFQPDRSSQSLTISF